jgi:hypothetical protein
MAAFFAEDREAGFREHLANRVFRAQVPLGDEVKLVRLGPDVLGMGVAQEVTRGARSTLGNFEEVSHD